MTGRERGERILKRQKADRIGLYEHFWGDTHRAWTSQGHIKENESFGDHFDYDFAASGAFNMMANPGMKPEILEETDETILARDGNYAVLRRHKLHDTTPEHVDFLVKDYAAWKEHIKPKLTPGDYRIDFAAYEAAKKDAAEKQKFFTLNIVHVFELMHPVCGHEHMLAGMILEPEWIAEMSVAYADLILDLMEILFARSGKPDGIWFYEDMGFKLRPFMSPAMYRQFIFPAHKKTIDYAHALKLPVIMHSCGFIEPLLPHMVEAGIDCLQVIEIKAGMDLLRIFRQYGDVLSLMGGIDVRKLYTNDKKIIDEELEEKIPVVKHGYGYSLHSDHSIPNTVEYETYRYFIEKGLELGKTE